MHPAVMIIIECVNGNRGRVGSAGGGTKERKLYFVTKWTTLCSVFYWLVAGVVADTPVRSPSPFRRHLMFRGSHLRRVEAEGTGEIIAPRRVLSRIDEKDKIDTCPSLVLRTTFDYDRVNWDTQNVSTLRYGTANHSNLIITELKKKKKKKRNGSQVGNRGAGRRTWNSSGGANGADSG